MIGPTGSGKTFLAQTWLVANVPFAIGCFIIDRGRLCGETWKYLKLIQAADFNIERAERGIIYVDLEIDKIAKRVKMYQSLVTFLVKGSTSSLLKLSKEQ